MLPPKMEFVRTYHEQVTVSYTTAARSSVGALHLPQSNNARAPHKVNCQIRTFKFHTYCTLNRTFHVKMTKLEGILPFVQICWGE